MPKCVINFLSILKTNFFANKQNNTFIFNLGIVFFLINIVKAFFVYWPLSPIYILELLWFCNFFSFLLCFVIFFGPLSFLKKISTSILTFAIPAQGLWIVYYILSVFNIYKADRLFYINDLLTYEGYYYKFIYSLSFFEHVTLIPFTFYICYRLGFDYKNYKYIFILPFVFLLISFVFSPDQLNINCIKYPCDVVFGSKYITYSYDYLYFLKEYIYWLILFIINYEFLKIVFKKVSNL